MDLGIEVRLAHRAAHVYLDGLVAEGLGPKLLEDFAAAGAYIRFVKGGRFRSVLALAAPEIIYVGDLVAAGEEAVGNVRTYKSGRL